MLALRAILWYLVTVLTLVPWTLVLYIVAPFGFKARIAIARSWSKAATLYTQWICGISYEMIGTENLPSTPVIFFSKHQSAWETLTFLSLLPPNCFVCKKALLNIPVFGWAMRITKQIPIDRKQGVQALKSVIKEGKNRLSLGLSIIIFPEGTRVAPKTYPKFHKSGAALARATHAPIVPIAHNAGSYWRRNGFLKYPGKIKIVIGKPISTEGKSVDDISETTYQWINETMKGLE